MNQTLYLVLGVLAMLVTVGVVAGGRQQELSSEAGLVGSAAAIAMWAVFAINSFNVEVVTNTGEIVTTEYRSLAVLGVAGAAIALLVLIQAGLQQLDQEEYA
jgi:hypothetical protein